MGRKLHILTGNRYGKLLVLDIYVRPPAGKKATTKWLCVCDCGKKVYDPAGALKDGTTSSCGCRHYDVVTKHGHTGNRHPTKEYICWQRMKARCYNHMEKNYKYYGARGITVCARWLHSFENFYADMGTRPDGHSIDRINNNLGYFPENCRWATAKQQANNQRKPDTLGKKNHFYGKKHTGCTRAKMRMAWVRRKERFFNHQQEVGG